MGSHRLAIAFALLCTLGLAAARDLTVTIRPASATDPEVTAILKLGGSENGADSALSVRSAHLKIGAGASVPASVTTASCAPGEAVDAHTCVPCSPGEHYVSPGVCVPCAAGSFSNSAGATRCTPCDAASVQPLAGQTQCNKCSGAQWARLSDVECQCTGETVNGECVPKTPPSSGTSITVMGIVFAACLIGGFLTARSTRPQRPSKPASPSERNGMDDSTLLGDDNNTGSPPLPARGDSEPELRGVEEPQGRRLSRHMKSDSHLLARLQQQVRQAGGKTFSTNYTPMQRAIDRLAQIRDGTRSTANLRVDVEYILSCLTSDAPFVPDFSNDPRQMRNIDPETQEWIKSWVQVKRAATTATSPVMSKAHSSVSLVPNPTVNEVDVKAMLREHLLSSWDFDVFELGQATFGHPLYYIGMAAFEITGASKALNVDNAVLGQWLRAVEAGYQTNPYHNSMHAADVLHATFFFLRERKLGDILSNLERFACLVGAIIHDIDHPGVNNTFLVNTGHEIALRYNDRSVLENHHVATAFAQMQEPALNILATLTPQQYHEAREMMINVVLATDVSQHFAYVSKFKTKLSAGQGFNQSEKADRMLLMETAIKCADISNPARSRPLALRWTALIMEEFFAQGDMEKARSLPVSKFMDRETTSVPQCQIGFIDFLVGPIFTPWAEFLASPEAQQCCDHTLANRQYWQERHEADKKKEEAAAAAKAAEAAAEGHLKTN